ncbi:MAG: hypothetical protein LBV23_05885 [Deltaproteobacteria bacterium]|nr:hypothetical protein [Deltaproteobacteria bacterium]
MNQEKFDKIDQDNKINKEDKIDSLKDNGFNREDFFKTIRNEFLNKMGLPADTKPGRVVNLLEIQKELERLKKPK